MNKEQRVKSFGRIFFYNIENIITVKRNRDCECTGYHSNKK